MNPLKLCKYTLIKAHPTNKSIPFFRFINEILISFLFSMIRARVKNHKNPKNFRQNNNTLVHRTYRQYLMDTLFTFNEVLVGSRHSVSSANRCG